MKEAVQGDVTGSAPLDVDGRGQGAGLAFRADYIAQNADAFDLKLDHIAGGEKAVQL
jgi:hypothetical protein